MKKVLFISVVALAIAACGNRATKEAEVEAEAVEITAPVEEVGDVDEVGEVVEVVDEAVEEVQE